MKTGTGKVNAISQLLAKGVCNIRILVALLLFVLFQMSDQSELKTF